MWVLSTATYGSNTRSSPPAHVANGGFLFFFCLRAIRFAFGQVWWVGLKAHFTLD